MIEIVNASQGGEVCGGLFKREEWCDLKFILLVIKIVNVSERRFVDLEVWKSVEVR